MTRRSPSVVLLDAMLGFATRVQTANLPGSGGGERRGRAAIAWLVGGTLVAVGGTALLIGAVLRAPDGLTDLPPGGVVAAPAPSTSATPAPPVATRSSASATPSRPAGSTSATSRPPEKAVPSVPSGGPSVPAGAHLSAAFSTPGGLLGYRAEVEVTSAGPATANGWQLTVTMPRSTLQLSPVSGATVKQNGTVWTFTPTDDTRRVPAGSTVTVVFDVLGATLLDAKPAACAINGEACSGLT
ncbi:hypothetical protein GCM10010172_47160 [Paractinoplanes ferrugineus]|uniref:CBM2 domain-containing protein n=1 Tax=Paractinoplanes ferrugineus TaxID=113564 RepID=A0A919IWQ4_9ACTN|nr:cellulose binding domain-containing protein [Actinoplanes ferrugineus]GIE10300.1 hypothetical protein Afe05nite_21400 [Actinoplanes ferrugineus]